MAFHSPRAVRQKEAEAAVDATSAVVKFMREPILRGGDMGQADCATALPIAMTPTTDTPTINCVMRVMIASIQGAIATDYGPHSPFHV